jgi:hypothetical protein
VDEFLAFRKMITPMIIQIIFWVGVVACVITGFGAMGQSFFAGLMILLIGPLVVRIYCELLILLFRIHDTLTEIRDRTPSIGR